MSKSQLTQEMKPKKPLSRSCDTCRIRKVRCEKLPEGGCSRCLKSDIPCLWNQVPKKRGRNPKPSTIAKRMKTNSTNLNDKPKTPQAESSEQSIVTLPPISTMISIGQSPKRPITPFVPLNSMDPIYSHRNYSMSSFSYCNLRYDTKMFIPEFHDLYRYSLKLSKNPL